MPPPSRPEDRAKASAADTAASWAEVVLEVDSVESLLHQLRGQYEQFFLGFEKRPPTWSHDQFKKRLAALKTVPARNSAITFRIQALQATSSTYERMWARTLQQMEDGTYRRDVFKARMRRKNSNPEVPAASASGAANKPGAGKSPAAQEPTGGKEPTIHIAG